MGVDVAMLPASIPEISQCFFSVQMLEFSVMTPAARWHKA